MGLCARFGWLPSQAENEDWATLAELQERLMDDDEQTRYRRWQEEFRRRQ